MIDIFIKSYPRDYKWLEYSLKSVDKFVVGYRKIILLMPKTDDIINIPIGLNVEIHFTNDYGNGYLYQQWCKMNAHSYTDADFIFFMDSDCLFYRHTNLNDFIIDNKPQILYTDYSKVGDAICWKEPTEKFMRTTVKYEFMRRNGLMYHRDTLENINSHYRELESTIMKPKLFSEFNAIGAWCFFNENEKYDFINTEQEYKPMYLKQGWTWGSDEFNKSQDTAFKFLLEGIEITNEGYAIIERDTHIGKWVKEHKRLDFDQSALPNILNYIKDGDTILDIGANIGCYSYGFLSKDVEIICFEPSEDTFKCLEYNLGKFKNVQLNNIAIGNKVGSVSIISENDNIGMSFCSEGNDVQITTIDNLNLKKLDFIKIDVEGFELDVLLGGYKTIQKFKPKMYIEINEHTFKRKGISKTDVFSLLDELQYTYKNIYEGVGMNDEQFDVICLPQ